MVEETVNVGIKEGQKKAIEEILRSGRFKSVNQFVQRAVSEMINTFLKEKPPKKDSPLKLTKDFVNKLLKKDIEGQISLHTHTIMSIKHLLEAAKRAELIYSISDETAKLFELRSLKSNFWAVISSMINNEYEHTVKITSDDINEATEDIRKILKILGAGDKNE